MAEARSAAGKRMAYYNATVRRLLSSVAVGLTLAVASTVSPLGIVFLVLAPAVVVIAGRGLPADERRALYVILGAALAARVAAVIGLVLIGIPNHNILSVGALSGDEAYNLGRAIRTRDILAGFAGLTHYDFFVVTDEYGRSSYLGLLTFLQVVFGPAPYGIRLLNALLFTTGAAILFRLVRPAFGRVASFTALTVVLFLPSLFYSSVTLLKEALYFLAAVVFLASIVTAIRIRRPIPVISLLLLAAGCLWIVDDLRRGAVVLMVAGIGCGLAIRILGGLRHRAIIVPALIAAVAIVVVVAVPIRQLVLTGLSSAAKQHSGHVFTVGHAYKLLDEGFYMNPATPTSSTIFLTPPQAIRFVVRGLSSFALTPLPWQARSNGERAFLPEHMLWYLLIVSLPVGFVAGWRRDPTLTSMIVGFAIPTAVVLALTNGNVGTLLRLRGLITPYIAWVGVLGLCVIADTIARAVRSREPRSIMEPA